MCSTPWTKPSQGYAQGTNRRRPSWHTKRRVSPPPGLPTSKPTRPARLQKSAADILAPAWSTLDEDMKAKLTELGIDPTPKVNEPDLQSVLKENMASLPTPVKELVERLTKPQPETEKDMASRLKQQVTTLRDISIKKQTLQQKIDNTKKLYQELLDEMKALQTRLEQEQATLTTVSTAYLTKVSSSKGAQALQPLDTEMADSMPETVAGFITTLGVNLTQAQKEQLSLMLKRPPAEDEALDEEAKRRKTALASNGSSG